MRVGGDHQICVDHEKLHQHMERSFADRRRGYSDSKASPSLRGDLRTTKRLHAATRAKIIMFDVQELSNLIEFLECRI